MPQRPPLFQFGDKVVVTGYKPDGTMKYDGMIGEIERFGDYSPGRRGPDKRHGYDYRVRMDDGYDPLCWEDNLTKYEDPSDDNVDDAAFAAFISE